MDRTGPDRILGVDLFCDFCYSISPGLHRRAPSLSFFPVLLSLSAVFCGDILPSYTTVHVQGKHHGRRGRGDRQREISVGWSSLVGVVGNPGCCQHFVLLSVSLSGFGIGTFSYLPPRLDLGACEQQADMALLSSSSFPLLFLSAVVSLRFASFPRCFFSRAIRTFTTSSTTSFLF